MGGCREGRGGARRGARTCELFGLTRLVVWHCGVVAIIGSDRDGWHAVGMTRFVAQAVSRSPDTSHRSRSLAPTPLHLWPLRIPTSSATAVIDPYTLYLHSMQHKNSPSPPFTPARPPLSLASRHSASPGSPPPTPPTVCARGVRRHASCRTRSRRPSARRAGSSVRRSGSWVTMGTCSFRVLHRNLPLKGPPRVNTW